MKNKINELKTITKECHAVKPMIVNIWLLPCFSTPELTCCQDCVAELGCCSSDVIITTGVEQQLQQLLKLLAFTRHGSCPAAPAGGCRTDNQGTVPYVF